MENPGPGQDRNPVEDDWCAKSLAEGGGHETKAADPSAASDLIGPMDHRPAQRFSTGVRRTPWGYGTCFLGVRDVAKSY